MEKLKVVIFAEAEKGKFRFCHFFSSVKDLFFTLGTVSKESQGIFFAIKAISYGFEVVFIRVEEEGISFKDYLYGLKMVKDKKIENVSAFMILGIGNKKIVKKTNMLCRFYKSLLILNEKDFYDYLTED